MKNKTTKQQGLTLIELMISMVIGLVLMAGALRIMQSNKQASDSSAEQARMQENARFVTGYLKDFLTIAGFTDYFQPLVASASGVATESVLFTGCQGSIACSSSTDDATGDVLTIGYEVPAEVVRIQGSFPTCNGFIVNAANQNAVRRVADTFRLAQNAAGETVFQCRSHNLADNTPLGDWIDLAGGVWSFHVLYGVNMDATPDTDPAGQSAYLNATELLAQNYPREELSARILSIKFAFLISSDANTSNSVRVSETYYVLDSDAFPVVNGSLATIYSTTLKLRNGG